MARSNADNDEQKQRPDATFEPAKPGRLRDQPGGLLDDEGEDRRQYTGEPVETDDGWVLPEQQNVGPRNEAHTPGTSGRVAIRRDAASPRTPRTEDRGKPKARPDDR